MPQKQKVPSASIQASSVRLVRLMTVLSVILWILLLLERFGWTAVAISHGDIGPEFVRRIGFELVAACPEAIYLLSLWWIRESLAAYARGDLYGAIVPRMLRRVG